MAGSTFQTNPLELSWLLQNCHRGLLALPEFQRDWVWDEDRIKSLIASVSNAFPIGALMTLDTGGPVKFQPRPIEGAPPQAWKENPLALLLDGQQRITSLYQVTSKDRVVETVTPKSKKVKRWFYLDIRKCLDITVDRENAVIGVPEDRMQRRDFGREVVLDLSTAEREYALLMFPLGAVFDWADWQEGFFDYWGNDKAVREEFKIFARQVLDNFKQYRIPVIALDRSTSKEAVCVVFEKVNTGGKPLDAFELVTAMYAAEGHLLRDDWIGKAKEPDKPGRHRRLVETLRLPGQKSGIIADVSNTDFLQVISLFHTRDRRRAAEAAGKTGKELPSVTSNRQALLDLPLEAYKKYETIAERGFERAAKFLFLLHIYRTFDLPYQSQVVPLAAILADVGDAWEHEANRAKLVRWYWNGVFGELYGSAVDTRIAKDFVEVPLWFQQGPEPTTVSETIFRADRLKTMRMRLSAAYKGVNALLMKEGALDFRSGQPFDSTVFFGENVDIHHIFPQKWCKAQRPKSKTFDSIINKTPLSFRTNRIIGGEAPSAYLAALMKGNDSTPAVDSGRLDGYLASHLIDPTLLRADAFEAFMTDRQQRLLALIEHATGKAPYRGDVAEEGEDVDESDETEAAESVADS